MKTSINTAIFIDRLNKGESQIDCLKDLNVIKDQIDNIQVRGEFFKEDTKDEELSEIIKLADKNDWGVYYSVPEEFFSSKNINSDFEQNLDMAKRHNIKHLKYFIGDATGVSNEKVKQVNDALKNSDVDLTLENLSNSTGDLFHVKQGLNLIANMSNIGFTFDAGNWYWVNENPNEAFDELKSQITNFHLKDIKDKATVLLGEGMTDWRSMVQELTDNIPIFLEYGIPDEQISNQIKLVNDEINSR